MSLPLAVDFSGSVLDVGTGGGLPGLVCAICAPQARFTLLDERRKKVMAVAQMAKALDLRT